MSQNELIKALVKAQKSFPTVVKNRTNPHLGNRYADLNKILECVLPVLNENNLFMRQCVTGNEQGISVETIITHESGESISSGILFIPVSSNERNKAQAYGSARTYACRYSLSSILGIAADDDDDGHAAGGQAQEPVRKAPNRKVMSSPVTKAQKLESEIANCFSLEALTSIANDISKLGLAEDDPVRNRLLSAYKTQKALIIEQVNQI